MAKKVEVEPNLVTLNISVDGMALSPSTCGRYIDASPIESTMKNACLISHCLPFLSKTAMLV